MALRSCLVLGLLWVLQLHIAAAHKAAYFITNNPAGNYLASLKIDTKNGNLSLPVLTPTGGKGQIGLNSTGAPTTPDSLFSADSVVVDGNYLFVVNPGSNTLSLFYIHEHDPTRPILVGEPADTLGEFPVAVAYSSKLETACVLNSGKNPSVTCYSVSKEGLKTLDTSPRSITTSPLAGTSAASDILFNPSSTALFAVIKGTPFAKVGEIYVWPVVDGKVSTDPVISNTPSIILDFGAVFLGGDDRLYVTDALTGGAIVNVSSSFKIQTEAVTIIPGTSGPCWANYAPEFDSVYVLTSEVFSFTVVDPNSGAIKGYVPFPGTAVGTFDAAIDGKFIYVLSGDPAVLVFKLNSDIAKIKLVQKIDLSALGNRADWEGLAIFHGRS